MNFKDRSVGAERYAFGVLGVIRALLIVGRVVARAETAQHVGVVACAYVAVAAAYLKTIANIYLVFVPHISVGIVRSVHDVAIFGNSNHLKLLREVVHNIGTRISRTSVVLSTEHNV